LIIVEKQSQADRLAALASSKRGEWLISVVLYGAAAGEPAGRDIAFKTKEDYGLSEEYLQEEGLKWYRSFPNHKVKDDKSIKELLTYERTSLWWLVEQQIFISRFAFPAVLDKIKLVIMLDAIIKAEKPGKIYYADTGSPAAEVIKLICKSRDITAVALFRSSGIERRLYRRFRAVVYVYGLWSRLLLRKAYWRLLQRRPIPGKEAGKKKLLIFSCGVWSNIRDLSNGELRRGDPYLDSVIELVKEEIEVLDVDVPAGDWGLKLMKEKARQRRMMFRPFESYLNAITLLRAFRAAGRLHGYYKSLSQSAAFGQTMRYDGLALFDLFENNLSLFFSRSYLAMIVAFIEMAERMIEAENPAVIVHYGDLPDSGRAVIARAKARDIPVLLLQHGLYGRYSHYFNHIESDIGHNREAVAPYCPAPDKFAVSDGYTKEILVKRGGFRDEDVVITGQPRYDVIAEADSILNQGRVYETLGLNPGKKLVAWMTATHAFSPGENRRYIESVYSAVSSLGDSQLLIKLHPGENQRAPLYTKNRMLEPVIVDKYGLTTFELLNAADAVITNGWCSTAIEAIMLGKPVIALDCDGGSLPPYVECGAAVSACDKEAVVSALENILHNDDIRRWLAEGRRRFIAAGGYITDGGASHRVVDLIKRMGINQRGVKRVLKIR
jgi:glycosyltransferase involved in cell wall biosynthesis